MIKFLMSVYINWHNVTYISIKLKKMVQIHKLFFLTTQGEKGCNLPFQMRKLKLRDIKWGAWSCTVALGAEWRHRAVGCLLQCCRVLRRKIPLSSEAHFRSALFYSDWMASSCKNCCFVTMGNHWPLALLYLPIK